MAEIKTRKPKVDPRRLLLTLWLKALDDPKEYNETSWREMETLVTCYIGYEAGREEASVVVRNPWTLLHTLWTKAVETPGYKKEEWLELEVLVLRFLEHEKAAARDTLAAISN